MAHRADKAEEELRRLSMEMRYLEQTADALQQRISMVNAALTDINYANMTLDGIEKEKESSEMLVPIGGSSYIKTMDAAQQQLSQVADRINSGRSRLETLLATREGKQ